MRADADETFPLRKALSGLYRDLSVALRALGQDLVHGHSPIEIATKLTGLANDLEEARQQMEHAQAVHNNKSS